MRPVGGREKRLLEQSTGLHSASGAKVMNAVVPSTQNSNRIKIATAVVVATWQNGQSLSSAADPIGWMWIACTTAEIRMSSRQTVMSHFWLSEELAKCLRLSLTPYLNCGVRGQSYHKRRYSREILPTSKSKEKLLGRVAPDSGYT